MYVSSASVASNSTSSSTVLQFSACEGALKTLRTFARFEIGEKNVDKLRHPVLLGVVDGVGEYFTVAGIVMIIFRDCCEFLFCCSLRSNYSNYADIVMLTACFREVREQDVDDL